MKRLGITHYLLIVALLSIQACGSSDTGGVSEFNTVTATATVDSGSNPLLADLAIWTGDPCAAGSTYSITNNIVNFTIRSVSNTTLGKPLPLLLQYATIVLTPADSNTADKHPLSSTFTPAYQDLRGYTVPAAGSLSVPVEVVTHLLKDDFIPSLVCTGNRDIYSYNATITFDAIESGGGKARLITAGMVVRFADFADQ